MRSTADVVVIGGGVMGASILYNLASRNMSDCLMLEKDVLASGSTGRAQGILRMHYSNEITTSMALESLHIFRDFEEIIGGPSGYVCTGYVFIAGEGDISALERNVSMQKSLGVATCVMTPQEVSKIHPMMKFEDGEMCAYETESGHADPYSVTHTYTIRAKELGARSEVRTPVKYIKCRGGRVTGVVTGDGVISTPVVIVASGPWSKALLKTVGVDVPLETVRHQIIALRRSERKIPSHPGIGDSPNGLSARMDAEITLVGVGEDELADPGNYQQGVDMVEVDDVLGKLNRRMIGMDGALYRGGWSGLFTTTPDWHPVLGPVDGVDGLYCAVGFSGHGFKLAPMVGVLMAEAVIDGDVTSIDVSDLNMNRFEKGELMKSSYRMRVLA